MHDAFVVIWGTEGVDRWLRVLVESKFVPWKITTNWEPFLDLAEYILVMQCLRVGYTPRNKPRVTCISCINTIPSLNLRKIYKRFQKSPQIFGNFRKAAKPFSKSFSIFKIFENLRKFSEHFRKIFESGRYSSEKFWTWWEQLKLFVGVKKHLSWFLEVFKSTPAELLRTRNDGKVKWRLLPVEYYSLYTAEYATVFCLLNKRTFKN